MINKYFKKITLLLSLLLIITLIIVGITSMRPLDIPINTDNHRNISIRKFIILPGSYGIVLIIKRNQGNSYGHLTKIFKSWYEIQWSLKNNQKIVSGVRTPNTSKGVAWVSRAEYAINISRVDMIFGYNEINIEIKNGLSGLKNFPTRLALHPGANIKSSPGGFNNDLGIRSFLLLLCLLPIVITLWIIYIICIFYIKLKKAKMPPT